MAVPFVALLPDQLPLAVQDVELVDDHVSVEEEPDEMEFGEDESKTVGVFDVLVLNVAVTSATELSVHVPAPEHPPPDQSTNIESVLAIAVKVIDELVLIVAVQVLPVHISPVPVIFPEPVPDLVTVTL